MRKVSFISLKLTHRLNEENVFLMLLNYLTLRKHFPLATPFYPNNPILFTVQF